MHLDDAEIVARLLADARLLRQPLVRHGNDMTVGRDEATWAGWLKPQGGAGIR
jgi:arsenate reductase-like glutaredoxin family protein